MIEVKGLVLALKQLEVAIADSEAMLFEMRSAHVERIEALHGKGDLPEKIAKVEAMDKLAEEQKQYLAAAFKTVKLLYGRVESKADEDIDWIRGQIADMEQNAVAFAARQCEWEREAKGGANEGEEPLS